MKNPSKSQSTDGERSEGPLQVADANHQDNGYDEISAGVFKVCLAANKRPDSDGGDHAEGQDEHTTHDGRRNGLQKGSQFADEREQDSKTSCDLHVDYLVGLGDSDGSRDLGVGRVGWTTEESGEHGGKAIA